MTWWDTLIDSIGHFLKNGFSWASLGGVFLLFLRNRRLKQIINRHLPRRFRDRDQDDIQEIKQDVKAIKQFLGVKEGWTANTSSRTSKRSVSVGVAGSTYSWPGRSAARYVRRYMNLNLRRMNMKSYLKKLGKTKFQAFLVVTITNAILLWGSLTGHIHVNDTIDSWMPILNLLVQTVTTVVYQIIEGSIDREAQKQFVYVVKPDNEAAAALDPQPTTSSVTPSASQYLPYDEIMKKVTDVHIQLNQAYDDLQSGKVTDTVRNAQHIYNSIHDFLNERPKGGESDATQKPA